MAAKTPPEPMYELTQAALNAIFSDRVSSPPSIYEELIDMIETAEAHDDMGEAMAALVALVNTATRIRKYTNERAN